MNTTIKLVLSALLLAVLFTGCFKENIDEIIPGNLTFQTDTVSINPIFKSLQSYSPDSLQIVCLRIPYPVDFLRASGNTITVNSETELDSVSMLPDSLVDFIYPVDAVNNSGLIQINDIEGLAEAITYCDTTAADCSVQQPHVILFFNALNILTLNKYVYEINYPVSLVVQGNPVVLNQDDDYLPAVGGSPFDLLPTELVYPITITQFGRDIVLNNDNDVCAFYQTLDEPCGNKPAHIQFFFNEGGGTPVNCSYFISYPLNIVSNGDTILVQTRDEYLTELNSSPNAYNDIDLLYPVNASKFINGQQLSFGSGVDICQYLDNCQ